MSVKNVSAADSQSNLASKIAISATAGAIIGGGYTATKKNWLYHDMPSDTFVKQVSKNLKKDMTSDELKENYKIEKFLKDAVEPRTSTESLKAQIKDSKELSLAIKSNPSEDIDSAIERVFSQPSDKVRDDLVNLQYKTKIDKKAGKNTARKLIMNNFDASGRKLSKHAETSENVFRMIKNTASHVQAKAVGTAAALTALGTAALALILSDVPDKN